MDRIKPLLLSFFAILVAAACGLSDDVPLPTPTLPAVAQAFESGPAESSTLDEPVIQTPAPEPTQEPDPEPEASAINELATSAPTEVETANASPPEVKEETPTITETPVADDPPPVENPPTEEPKEIVEALDESDFVTPPDWFPGYGYPSALFGFPTCEMAPPAGLDYPGVMGLKTPGDFGVICLYGFEQSEQIDVQLFDSTGAHAGTSSFIVKLDGEGRAGITHIKDESAPEPQSYTATFSPESSMIEMGLWLPAAAPLGTWQIKANSLSHNVVGQIEILADDFPWISTAPSAKINPFEPYPCADYQPDDIVFVHGVDPNADSKVNVAVFHNDNGSQFVGYQSVNRDVQGRFMARFTADIDGPGLYIVLANVPPEYQEGGGFFSVFIPWYACYRVAEKAEELQEQINIGTAVPTGTSTTMPTSTDTAAPTSTDTAVPTSTATATPTIIPTVEQAVIPADCIPFNPQQLSIMDEGPTGWLLTDGVSRMKLLANEADALDALALAQRHTAHCFIGRNNQRPNRIDYIVEYWMGSSGLGSVINQVDCIPFDRNGLQIVDRGDLGWILTDGRSSMLLLDNEANAQEALALAKIHQQQCFIGRDNNLPDRKRYILGYWK